MNLSKIDERLLSYSGATKAFHEKWGWMVYWVGGKPERIIELRSEYPESIFPGYYSDGRTWISIDLDTDLPEDIVFDLCKRSYELVFATLPKKVQKELMSI